MVGGKPQQQTAVKKLGPAPRTNLGPKNCGPIFDDFATQWQFSGPISPARNTKYKTGQVHWKLERVYCLASKQHELLQLLICLTLLHVCSQQFYYTRHVQYDMFSVVQLSPVCSLSCGTQCSVVIVSYCRQQSCAPLYLQSTCSTEV